MATEVVEVAPESEEDVVILTIVFSTDCQLFIVSIREKIRCGLRFFLGISVRFLNPPYAPSFRYHLFPVFLKRQKTKLLYLACDFLGALVYQLTSYVSMIVLFIVPFMFPSKLSSVLFIFTSTSASYYAILKVSVISKVRNLVKIL